MNKTLQTLGAAALLATLAACGGGGGDGGGTGTLRLALTDAPACGYESVNVTVERVRVHQSSGAADNAAGWSEIVLAQPKTIDLLDLTNGALEELGQTALPAGSYTQLRLVLAANSGGNADANWIVKEGQTAKIALDTPSAQQSGLKLNVNMTVQPNQVADFVIDFDACKSVVVAGSSGKYNLKPVLRVIPRTFTGVSGAVAQVGSAVSLQQAGTPVRATVADAQGNFVLRPIEPGSYTLVITRPGYATAVVKEVSVPSGQTVVVGSAPIAQDVSTDGTTPGLTATVSGKVSTTEATAVDALVSLRQALDGGLPIELGALPVLSATPTVTTQGNYAFAGLPLNDPRVATYSASGAPLTFATDTTVAGKLSVRAVANGVTKDAGPLTLIADTDTNSSAGDLSANFTFP